jgi:sortase A
MTRLRTHKLLQFVSRLLFVSALALLGYVGAVAFDAWRFQARERDELERLLASRSLLALATSRIPIPATVPMLAGDLFGRMDIPRLGLSVIIREGTSAATLRRAIGHIDGTALPGVPGNVGVSGHRDTFFRPLQHIRPTDLITLATLQGEYHYRVVSTKVVGPDDVSVLDPSGDQILTLVTCHPFIFVGPAPNRFIVRAERVGDPL